MKKVFFNVSSYTPGFLRQLLFIYDYFIIYFKYFVLFFNLPNPPFNFA